MAETYSIGTTGAPAGQLQQVASIKVGDSAARPSLPNYQMSSHTAVLCQNADGSQSWYTIDNERSRPGNLILRPL